MKKFQTQQQQNKYYMPRHAYIRTNIRVNCIVADEILSVRHRESQSCLVEMHRTAQHLLHTR